MMSWALYTFVMKPLQLQFLQVLVFIGVVAFVVQFLDTMLKKTHRTLHQKFGIYLVLITTNCIILAVPLLNAAADSGPARGARAGAGLGRRLRARAVPDVVRAREASSWRACRRASRACRSRSRSPGCSRSRSWASRA